MKYIYTFILLTCFASCSQTPVAIEQPDTDPKLVLRDFNSWWSYNYTHIDLSANFTALDTNNAPISKEIFLKQLSSGEYIALNIVSEQPGSKLRLYKLTGITDENIRSNAKVVGEEALRYYKVEGTPLPGSGFTDINGKQYNKETLAGKILVIKCWFIHCVPCVQEMPALNEAIKKYKDRDDVVFLSLAIDTPDELKTFLQKTKFDYAVVAGQEDYMNNALKVSGYPTHFIVNRSGNIVKMTNRYEQMLRALEEEIKIQK